MVTPGSRLRDDLYVLYLVALSWFLLPVYGQGVALLLPSDAPNFVHWLDVVVAAAGVAAVWWGTQGGPLVVSRAAVVHELGAPVSRISVLLPRMIRQALTGATFAGLGGALLLAIDGGLSDEFATPALVSLVCAVSATGVVFQAVLWLVVVHGRGPRLVLGAIGAAPPIGVMIFVAGGGSLSSGRGLGLLAGGAVLSGVLATLALRWIPAERLWRRASALESMRSSMQTFDFQRMLLDLRRAGDQPRPGRLRLARDWMPLSLWRQLAAMQHSAARHTVRLAAATVALASIVWFADARQGLVMLALAAVAGFIGFEFSGALAATADQGVFVVHYRRGSGSVLRGQLVTMLLSCLLVAVLAISWQWTQAPDEALSALLLCGYGALGAALQARLGSPNLGAFVDVVGFEMLGPLLWGRAMLGPAVLLIGAVSLSHLVLRPAAEASQILVALAAATLAAAAAVGTWPLEKTSA